jgi:NADH-quinone oxidoreductase subunit H
MADFFLVNFVFPVLQAAFVVIAVAIAVAILVYVDRKIMANAQLRVGPNMAGPFGILQSFADAIKGIAKETIFPTKANKFLFFLAPLLTFTFGFAAWAIIPFSNTVYFANINIGITYVMMMSALGVYGIIIAGFSSNSKYAFFGAIRSASQMISYEISIGFAILCVVLMSGSLNLIDVINAQQKMWFVVPLFPIFMIFFISILAETNRHPFDLPEAESELVSGYNVEYSSMAFTLFFLTEYANMMLMSIFASIMFLGGWLPPFNIAILHKIPGFIWLFLKAALLIYGMIISKISLPRYRYDQLMSLGWKVFLPFSLVYFLVIATLRMFNVL